MNRLHQILLIGTFLPLCWLVMMAVHELGHVLAAGATGGSVAKVVLHPLTISRTEFSVNPQPLIVVWAGPLVGVLLPLAGLAVFQLGFIGRWRFLMQFFAGFCLIANGTYIGLGSFDAIGDCGEMLKLGSPLWTLWLFGGVTLPSGLLLWHGLGSNFGLGRHNANVDRVAAFASTGMLLVVLLLEFVLSSE